MTEPCDLSAVEARRLIAVRKLSPVELLDSCITRIEKTNKAVNAIVAMDADAARRRASEIEQAIGRGEQGGCWRGCPSASKTSLRWLGSPPRRGRFSTRTTCPPRT